MKDQVTDPMRRFGAWGTRHPAVKSERRDPKTKTGHDVSCPYGERAGLKPGATRTGTKQERFLASPACGRQARNDGGWVSRQKTPASEGGRYNGETGRCCNYGM